MAPEGDSEHLRDLEEHAAEVKRQQEEGEEEAGSEEEAAEDEATADAAGSDGDPDSEYGVENDMRPGGPAAAELGGDAPTKRIDEDVTGKEETDDMSDIASDD